MSEQEIDVDVDAEFERSLAEFKGEPVKPIIDAPSIDTKTVEDAPIVEKKETAEDKAIAKGWSADKEKYEAENPDKEWMTAKNFLRMLDLRDDVSKSHKRISQIERDHKRQLSKLSEQVERLTKGETAKVVSDIDAQIRQAVADQDVELVEQLTAQKYELKQQSLKQDEPLAIDDTNDDGETQEQLQAAAQKWIAENPWYNKLTQAGRDQAAKLEADYRAKVDCTTEEALAYVAQEMGKDPIVAVLKGKLKTPDVSPRTSERATPASKYSPNQLNGADRELYKSLKNSGVWKTPADEQNYLKQVLSN